MLAKERGRSYLAFVDEDDMASDSRSAVQSQASVKKYVDKITKSGGNWALTSDLYFTGGHIGIGVSPLSPLHIASTPTGEAVPASTISISFP